MFEPEEFFDLKDFAHGDIFFPDEPVWTALNRLKDYMDSFFKDSWPLANVSGQVQKPLVIYNGKVRQDLEVRTAGPKNTVQVFKAGNIIEGPAVILPGAYLFDDRIIIGDGTVVEPGALIKGPAVIGKNTEVRQGAYIRGDCLVGEGCVVGHATEIKSSIMLDGAKAGHFAYIGDSILGNDVNLGAGTKLANLKMIKGNIVITIGRERCDTGRRKIGAILGDRTETGCNSVTSPGTLMGRRSIVYPAIPVPGGYFPGRTIIVPGKDSLKIHGAKS